jgi:Tol biopolymer transport system component
MSPEQAKGKTIDKRTDIWAFGCILYECLTGMMAFEGESVSETLASILKEEPDWEEVTNEISWRIKDLLKRTLQKDPSQRLRDMGDARIIIKEAIEQPFSSERKSTSGSTRLRRVIPWFFIPLAILITVFLMTNWFQVLEFPNQVIRLKIQVEAGVEMPFGQIPCVAVSPDGRRLIYQSEDQLFRHYLGEYESIPLPGTQGATTPFFSPDGKWIGFEKKGILKKIPIEGGPSTDLAPGAMGVGNGASWGEDGFILYSGIDLGKGLQRIPETGGEPQIITNVDFASESSHFWPQSLDGGRLVLFTIIGRSGLWEDASVVLQDIETGNRIVIAERATYGRYVATGHIFYAQNDGTILVRPFDLDRMRKTGSAIPVESGVRVAYWGGGASFAVSDAGTAAFVRGDNWSLTELYWVDRQGQRLDQVGNPMTAEEIYISPDGSQILAGIFQLHSNDIFMLDAETGEPNRLTFNGGSWEAVWAPDPEGRRIAYFSVGEGEGRIYLMDLNSDEDPVLFQAHKFLSHVLSWSPDGKWLIYSEIDPKTLSNLYARQISSPDRLITISATAASESLAAFSPDGKWIAYVSDQDGERQVYVVSFPEIRGRQQVSLSGGSYPRWSRTGDELFFWEDDTLMVTRVSTGKNFTREIPKALFIASRYRGWDVSADGQRFLIQFRNPDTISKEIFVTLNWFTYLKDKMDRNEN